ncbi:MAG: LPS export ABC transporter periplasmic protein LptC [Bacteroidetes bacterium]|nr:LPS export ABC transporter periplasmic protein LptC [Bacteroidota bacterium]
MQSKKNKIAIKLMTAALYTGCFLIAACENDQKQIDALTKDKPLVEQAKDMEAYLSQSGIVKAKLKSPLMLHYEKDTSYAEFPKTLHVDFFDSTAKIQSWLDAKYGKYFETQNKVFLRDSVIAINTNGDTLKTPELWWDQKKEIFYTEQYAEMHTKDKRIHGGRGLEATQDFKEITFKDTKGTVTIKETGLP